MPNNGQTPKNRESISYISFQDLVKNPIELEWIIEGMISKGDSTLIHAPGGVGKSMLALYIVLSLAALDMSPEKPLLIFDTFQVQKQTATFFIQAENSQVSMYTRIKAMCTGFPALEKGLNRVFVLSQFGDTTITGEHFSDREFCQRLVEHITSIEEKEGLKIDLLIIDPLISYHGGNENDAVETRETLDGITWVCSKARCSPILIHHAKKAGDSYRGSTAINDWARNRISLKREEGIKNIIGTDGNGKSEQGEKKVKLIRVTHEKCNNFEMFNSFLLEMDSNLCFKLANDQLKPKDVEDCKNVAQVLTDIGGHADSKNTLAKAYNEKFKGSPSTAKRIVDKAAKNGFIRQQETMKDGKNTHEYFSLEN